MTNVIANIFLWINETPLSVNICLSASHSLRTKINRKECFRGKRKLFCRFHWKVFVPLHSFSSTLKRQFLANSLRSVIQNLFLLVYLIEGWVIPWNVMFEMGIIKNTVHVSYPFEWSGAGWGQAFHQWFHGILNLFHPLSLSTKSCNLNAK